MFTLISAALAQSSRFGADRTVVLADRKDATSPRNAKRRGVKKMLDVAAENFDELWALWEEMHERSQSSDDGR